MKILLASASPRRRELLMGIGYNVHCISPDVQEIDGASGELPEDIALINAELKAKKVYEEGQYNEWDIIIAADTVVSLNNYIFGKPTSAEDARAMLAALSGHTHQVNTGFTLINRAGTLESGVVSADVSFRTLTEQEIAGYVATKESFDKAGSYAVQGAGAALIKSIKGSISTIIGLPIEEVIQHARRLLKNN